MSGEYKHPNSGQGNYVVNIIEWWGNVRMECDKRIEANSDCVVVLHSTELMQARSKARPI